ncbi:matrix metalloproteinase-2-like [Amphibalanus amphitrite]|uniref:matrix metalloproteinase-2-like n=1 Tax=Amphibalanus amphitrite TaxID=1232801 RepID=UPI001C91DC60|nr:matrix metalloproteinase-2-like [Amphibalanus amphitrite]
MATQGQTEPRRPAASARNSARTLALALLTTLALVPTPSTGAPPAVKADVRLPRDVSLKVTVRPSVLSRSRRAPFIDDDALNKLMHYGYLPESDRETGALRDESQLTDAIRQFQRYAHIPETGVVDELTRRQFAKPRCGLPDVQPRGRGKRYRRRHKRYALQGQKWDKTDLTWTVASHTPDLDSTTVYHELARALKIWSDASVLTFTYVHSADADIIISFHTGYHQDGYPFDGTGQILAHAFFPGTGRGGDAHFDEAETWILNHEEKKREGVSLFAVAAHEFGHSLGLSHSSRQDALMFPWYQSVSDDAKLPDDDRLGLEQMYGVSGTEPRLVPNPYPPRKQPQPRPTQPPRRRTTTRSPRVRPTRPEQARPDACDTHYDAISVIRGETFIFSGQYFWRINQYSGTHKPVPVKIFNFWYGLPENLTKIDAIYQRPHDHKIVIFIGRQFWVYNSNTPEAGYPQPLTALGLPESLDGLDAAMVWGHNGKTYLFRNDMYWRFDEAVGQVELDYPRDISVWHGVPYKLDAAFQYGGLTYFFKGRQFWRFDDRLMRVQSPVPSLSAVKWMGCPLTTARSDKLFSESSSGSSLSFVAATLISALLTTRVLR